MLAPEQIARLLQDERGLYSELIEYWVPAETRREYEKSIREDLEREGKHITPGHRWGGELGIRLARELRHVVDVRMSEFVASAEQQLHASVCIGFRYCEKRSKASFQDKVALATAIADSLLPSVTGTPLPLTTIAAYIARSSLLDRVCKCET